MTLTPATPYRITPSVIARYFFFDCDRFLRYWAVPADERAAVGIPNPDFDRSPLLRDVMECGLAWERKVVGEILVGRVSVADGAGPLSERHFDVASTLQRLQDEPAGRFIYQATLQPSRRFYQAFHLSEALVQFGDCRPDLIEVRDGPAGRLLRVIDIKRGEALQLIHRVQVLLYALTLDAALAEAGISDARADLETGAVWLGGQPEPQPFDMTSLRPYLEQFLRDDLPRLLSRPAEEAFWHFTYNCERCSFHKHCRAEMQSTNDLSRLTNLTAHGKRHLIELGMRSLPQLETLLQREDADDLLGRCASLAGERHYLEGRLAAFRDSAPRPHGSATALPIHENVAVFLTLQREPLGRSTYLAGLLVQARKEHVAVFSPGVRAKLFDPAGNPQPHVLVADRPDSVTAIRDEFVSLLHAVLLDIHRYNLGRPWEQQLSLQAYTHTERDQEQLTDWLLACLDEPLLAGPAMALLLHFQCPDLMLTDEHPDQPVPYPVVVLQNVLTKTIALPVEVSYTLPEALAALGSKFSFLRRDYYHYPLGNGLRSEAIHAAWYLGKPEQLAGLHEEARFYLQAQQALLIAVRDQVRSQLFAWPPKFQLPPNLAIRDPLLSRLAFFTRYESIMQYLQVREGRAEPQVVQSQLGLVAELVATSESEFEVDGETGLELEKGGLPAWLLSRANDAGRKAQLQFRDYACRSKMFMKPSTDLALVSIQHIEEDGGVPRRLRLKYATRFEGEPPRAGDRFHLHPRFTDFNTDRVVEFLQELDQAGGGLFVPLLRDPMSAARLRPLPTAIESQAVSGEASLSLTASQLAAYREIRRRRVVAVWGPPGTGKTHFLAASILGMATAYAEAGKPFRVLITAFTHAAIENLLRKIDELLPTLPGAGKSVALGKVKRWQAGATPIGDTVTEDKLAKWFQDHPQAVAGATVYSCLKARKKTTLPGFDLVVVDEASQVRVAEAAIPIALVGAEGRLVLAGDDLQLPPIVQGVYPDAAPGEPILHRSIFEAIRARVSADCPIVRKLLENRRMNDVLTSFAAGLLYGPDYRCFDASVASRRIVLTSMAPTTGLPAACLDPVHPLTVVILEGFQASKQNLVEAKLVADLVLALRDSLRDLSGQNYETDRDFFRHGVFVVSPHRAQNRAIRQELNRRRAWTSIPFVDTVDKMQGQEADVVVISYGVSDPEYALLESEFIYSVNRLNVAITRARSKSVVFLPRPLLQSVPRILDRPEGERGLAFMRNLVLEAEQQAGQVELDVGEGIRALVLRASHPIITH